MLFRRLQILTLSGILCLALSSLQAQAPTPEPSPFAPGETLSYNVTWSIFPAGEVVARLQQLGSGPGDAYEIDATAHSKGFVSLLFRLDNHYRAIFNPRTLCSREIYKTINEGRRHKKTHIVFDEARQVAVLNEVDLAKPEHPVKHTTNAIPGCVEDILTSFYYLRRQPMYVGEKIRLPVNDGSKTHEVVVDVQQRQRLQTPLGPRYALRVEPRALGDLYKKKGRLLIWFSDDKERLPLRIKAMMPIGAITGNLASVSSTPASKSSPP
ncbi:MAG: DUF3108 domain-containing protein [Terriglobia bacterium]